MSYSIVPNLNEPLAFCAVVLEGSGAASPFSSTPEIVKV